MLLEMMLLLLLIESDMVLFVCLYGLLLVKSCALNKSGVALFVAFCVCATDCAVNRNGEVVENGSRPCLAVKHRVNTS